MRIQRAKRIVEDHMESLWCFSELANKRDIRKAILSYKDEMIRQLNDGLRGN